MLKICCNRKIYQGFLVVENQGQLNVVVYASYEQHSQFQASLGHIERSCLQKIKKEKKKEKEKE
jgi:hypothetical protein